MKTCTKKSQKCKTPNPQKGDKTQKINNLIKLIKIKLN
jgi:hypothetical protein